MCKFFNEDHQFSKHNHIAFLLLQSPFLVELLSFLFPSPHLKQEVIPSQCLGVWVQSQHDVEVLKRVFLLREPLGFGPVYRGREGHV